MNLFAVVALFFPFAAAGTYASWFMERTLREIGVEPPSQLDPFKAYKVCHLYQKSRLANNLPYWPVTVSYAMFAAMLVAVVIAIGTFGPHR